MDALKICKNKNPVLRRKCKKLKIITDAERKLFDAMLETLHVEKGVGLAASQVGVLKPLIVVDIGEGPLKIVNPQIAKRKGRCFMEEGCLSLPEILVNVKRAKQIIVKGQNEFGKAVEIDASGLLARVLQHEIDHLNGVLIIDYLPWPKRMILKRKLGKKSS